MTISEAKIDEIKEGQRQRRMRARRRNLLIGFISLIICILTLILVTGLLLGGKAPTRFAFIDEGAVSASAQYPAVVLQAGLRLYAPADGIFVPLVQSGDRVPKDEVIALMVPESGREQLEEALRLRAVLVRHQLSDEVAAYDRLADAFRAATREEVAKQFGNLRLNVSQGNTLDLPQVAENLAALVKPAVLDMPRGLANTSEAADDLAQYNAALTSLQTISSTLQSSSSGLVIYQDGPDELLTGTDAETDLLPASLFDQHDTVRLPVLETKRAGDMVATLLTSTSADVAVFIPEPVPAAISEDKAFGVRIGSDQDYHSIRFDEITAVDGGVIARFLLPTLRADWRLEQQFPLDIRLSVTRGLEVPLRCLLDYDESDGIAILMKVSGGQIKRVPVFVTEEDGRMAVIDGRRADPLAPARYDLYVVNPHADLEGTYID